MQPLLLQHFAGWARSAPDAVAARHRDSILTYGDLDRQSNAVAHLLLNAGVGPEVPVAVCLKPTVDVLVSLLAIFKARGVYLPIDPTFPPALIGRMVEEAQPRVVLTHSTLRSLTATADSGCFCFDVDRPRLLDFPTSTPATQTQALPSDGAYLLYTSGTTGKPKGVIATQGNLAHYLGVAGTRYGFQPSDCFTSLARYTFSISLFDLLLPLTCGASVRLIDREDIFSFDTLLHHLQQVTVMHAGPSLLGSFFRFLAANPTAPQTLPNLRHVSTGGDMVPPSVMESMKRVFPQAEIFVIYGCTEISCMGTTYPVLRGAKATTTWVGQPFPGVELRLVDEKNEPVPMGQVGEIVFAGAGVARGYLKQPELTAAKFMELNGLRGYHTGDLGRLHADGNLEILGRRDFQVQVRGIRVELAGIEKTVLELGLAEQCIVVPQSPSEDDMKLVAFVVKPQQQTLSGFRRVLGVQLPDYMLPQHVVPLAAMPVTANGKVDRKALVTHSLDGQLGQEVTGAAPTTDAERRVLDILRRTLEMPSLGVEDDFFDCGGNSLLAISAMYDIERDFGVALPKYVMFESATARALAFHLAEKKAPVVHPILLNRGAQGTNLFMFSGIHIYRALAQALEDTVSAYGILSERELNPLDGQPSALSVSHFAREYLDTIQRKQPHGPYFLLGYSFAGIVAYEVAQQLKRAGEKVAFLGLVDAQLPEWTHGLKYRWEQLKRARSAPLTDVLNFSVKRLRQWWRKEDDEAFEHIRFADDARVGPLEARRDQLNQQAAAAYVPELRPYEGPVTLITPAARAKNYPLVSRSCGWRNFIPRLRNYAVGGNHFTLMSDAQHLKEVASVLRMELEISGAGVASAA